MRRLVEGCLWLGVLLADGRFVFLFLGEGLRGEAPLVRAGAVLAAVLLVPLCLRRYAGGKAAWTAAGLLAPLIVAVPVLGPALAAAVALAAGSVPARESRRGYRSLDELLDGDESAFYGYGTGSASIAEIMRAADPSARRHATLALRNIDPAESLPLLRRLSQDDDELVRLFALGELRRIVNEFEERSRSLARKRREGTATAGDLLLLAESYIEEVEVGLPLDERQRRALLDRALDVLWQARRSETPVPDIEIDILRCALLAYDTEVAERAFHRLRNASGVGDRLVLPRCEYCFQTADWRGLLSCLRDLPDSFRGSPRMEKVLALWEPLLEAGGGRRP